MTKLLAHGLYLGRTAKVVPAPVISGFNPKYGSTLANTLIPYEIDGVNFTGALSVKFNATDALSFVVNSDTRITAYAPALAAGSYSIKVTTLGGDHTLASTYRSFLNSAWYRADQHVNASGNASSLLNCSGIVDTNRNATNAVVGERPLIVSASANFNLMPTLSFDTGDHLRSLVWSAALAQPMTIYLVARLSTTGTRFAIDALTALECALYSPADIVTVFAGSAVSSALTWLNQTRIICAVINGGATSIYVDRYNTPSGGPAAGGANTLTGITIGASYAFGNKWAGEIAEVMCNPGAHDATHRQETMQSMGLRYGKVIPA